MPSLVDLPSPGIKPGSSAVQADSLPSEHQGAQKHRLSSCGAWSGLLCGMWDLPRSGIEPISLALAGGFFLPLSHQGRSGKHKLGIKPDEIRYGGLKADSDGLTVIVVEGKSVRVL